MTPITVHITGSPEQYARPLCKGKRYLPDTYRPGSDELTWMLVKATLPPRVHLASTGFTVLVSSVAEVQALGGRALKVCEKCEKALTATCDAPS